MYYWTGWVVLLFCQCTFEQITKAETYSLCLREIEHDPYWWRRNCHACLLWMQHLFGVWRRDPSCCAWDAKVAFEAFGCRCHLLETRRSRWIILNANIVRNAGPLNAIASPQFELKICAAYLSRWEDYKKTANLFNSHSLIVFFLQTRVWKLKLLSFSKNPKCF